MNRSFPVILGLALLAGAAVRAEPAALPDAQSAWRAGQPRACLKNGDALLRWFQERAQHLGPDGKLRVLIIGDSLSDGGYHWSHYFRRALQAGYGNGGPGNIWAAHAGAAPGQDFAPDWLFSPDDFVSYKGAKGAWRNGWGGRGDVWPYLGWNGSFLTTDSADAEYFLEAAGSRFVVVSSTGTFTSFDGAPVENRAGGFTVTLDDQRTVVPPATPGQPLDIALTRFEAPEGRHRLHIGAVQGGALYLHGVIVEKSAPGVVVYNISRSGYWAHNYIWRQPGWEKILTAINPDLTILFLSKPESGGSASPADPRRNVESEMLVARVTKALPQTRLLFMINWAPRDGQSPPDAQTVKDRVAWYAAKGYPYFNLQEGLDSAAMKQLGWFKDNIHLAQPGGQGIGEALAKLFLP
jgi:hypothetical protein